MSSADNLAAPEHGHGGFGGNRRALFIESQVREISFRDITYFVKDTRVTDICSLIVKIQRTVLCVGR
jgi:hypothetical protein